MSSNFTTTLMAFASLGDRELETPWEWAGHQGEQLSIRDALFVSLVEEQEAAAAASPANEAARIMCLVQGAFGHLRGLLAGVPDSLYDAEPSPGEWPLRSVLTHVLEVEHSYQNQVRYALGRREDEPIYTRNRPPPPGPDDVTGGAREWIQRLAQARAESREFLEITQEALTRPTRWVGYEVDVRFRLHRFAAHIGEHTIQCAKALAALRFEPAEAHRIARLISAERGTHELMSDSLTLARLDRGHAERLASTGPAAHPA